MGELGPHMRVLLIEDDSATADHLYGGMEEPELKIIDVFICKLRKKLADASAGRNYIETVWGRGYVLLKTAIALKPPVAQSQCAGSTVRSPSTLTNSATQSAVS